MTKREAMYVAIGCIAGFKKCGQQYETVKLSEVLDDTYSKYILTYSDVCHEVQLCDVDKETGERTRIAELSMERLTYDQIVTILLEALAYDIKNKE